MRKLYISAISVVLVVVVLAAGSPAAGVAGFSDVEDESFFAEAVQWMVDNEISTGTSPECFSPDRVATRGQTATLMWRMEGSPSAPPHRFGDVVSAYQQRPVSWMVSQGLTFGTTATTFSPGKAITRGEFAAMLYRLAGNPDVSDEPLPYSDVTAQWQQAPVAWMFAELITTGTSETTFSPGHIVTRGQLAAFLYRYKDSPEVTLTSDTNSSQCGPDSIIYAWRAGGLTESAISRVIEAARDSGSSASLNYRGTIGVREIRRGEHRILTTTPGWRIPHTARAVAAATAAPFHGADVAKALQSHQIAMSETSAKLSGAQVGDTVVFYGWDGAVHERTIGSVVPDEFVASSELTFASADAAAFGFARPYSIWILPDSDLATLEAGLEATEAATRWFRWVRSWEPLGQGYTLPTARLKELLGVFEYRLGSGTTIVMEPVWFADNIVRVNLPILGIWGSCHQAIVPHLTNALNQIKQAGLAHLIDVRDSRNGGCWNPVRIPGGYGGAISRHAWGLAVDINPSTNAWGAVPTMDPRIVEIFRANGFIWGGTWPRPDGMHFEWVGNESR